jgi:plastocyanin
MKNMNNKLTIILVVAFVLLLSGGVYYSFSPKAPSNPASARSASVSNSPGSYYPNAASGDDNNKNQGNGNGASQNTSQNVIVYSDSGFSPKGITVKLGDTVVFKNESSRGMWVASAPHPTHTDYPEFDAKKAYNNGEAYSFTFQKVGTWKFHNHLNPSDFGSVTVQ